MSFQIGDTVGDYKVLSFVGRGGMGEVFRVEHTVTRRVEAMKVLPGAHSGAVEQACRFLREIRLQASLSHPNIAAVHNAFWEKDDLVMVMELVEGESLSRRLERNRIPLAEGLGYSLQTLSGLSYAHQHGVTHRDIKPANIMVTPQGTVKLTDFGLAKAPSDPRLTDSGAMVGSLHYISPEQVRGAPDLDARADIYSFGAVLYELVTGRKPFDSGNAFALMLAHTAETPPPPTELDPTLPSALDPIILRALAKNPADRFQSADEFRIALESAASNLPGPVAPRPTRPRARSRFWWSGVAIVALASGAFVVTQILEPPARIEIAAPPLPLPRPNLDPPRPPQTPTKRQLQPAPAPGAPHRSLKDIRKVYVDKMDNDLDQFLRAAISRKLRGDLLVARNEQEADAILTGVSHQTAARAAVAGRWLGLHDTAKGVVSLIDTRDKRVLWTCGAGDRSWWGPIKGGGPRRVADRIVSDLKKALDQAKRGE